MSDLHLPSRGESEEEGDQPEVRLELTRAGVQQVLSLYSQEQEFSRSGFEFTLRLEDLQEAIQKRRQTLLTGLVVGIGVALLILWVSTPLYPVTEQVVLERHDISSDATTVGPGSGGSGFIATQAEIMQSPSVVAAAVAAVPRASHLAPEDDAELDAIESIQAAPVTGTQVVALGYLGPDAEFGVNLLGAIVEAYRDVLRKNEGASQAQKLRVKQTEIDVLETEAASVEEKLASLQAKNQIWGSAEDAVAAQSAILRDQSARLTEVRNERIALENRLATGGEQLAILDPATRSLQEQLWQAEAELARVQLKLRPLHPAVETAQQEVDVLRRQLRANSKATPEALKRDIEAALGLERELAAVFELERERMVALERYRQEEEVLLVELARIREMIDGRRRQLLDQRLVTRLAEAGEVGITARVIEAPTLPEAAVWPKPRLILAMGAIGGLIGGFVVALISLRRDRKYWMTSDGMSSEEPVRP